MVALDLPTHISHPYIFEHQGKIFCLPETADAREIALYRCHRFPQSWEKASTLIARVPGVDGTPFRHEERWWLFSTIRNGSVNSDLYAWHAPDLFGPWQPHQKNPVKQDAGSAKPAGTPFVSRGILYRPAQDCSKKYGRRVIINRIIRLTPDHFAEEDAATIGPLERAPFPSGIHTISAVEKITLIDGKRYRFKAAAALRSALHLRPPRSRR